MAFYNELDDDEDTIENIRHEAIETLTGAFEMMYPYAEDKLAFLSETIANIHIHRTQSPNHEESNVLATIQQAVDAERQKQIHENVLYALFEWFSHQSDLSDYLLPSGENLKKFNVLAQKHTEDFIIPPPSKVLQEVEDKDKKDNKKLHC